MKFIKRAIKNNYQKFILSLIAGTVKEKLLKNRDETLANLQEGTTRTHADLIHSVRRLEAKVDVITRAMASINEHHEK